METHFRFIIHTYNSSSYRYINEWTLILPIHWKKIKIFINMEYAILWTRIIRNALQSKLLVADKITKMKQNSKIQLKLINFDDLNQDNQKYSFNSGISIINEPLRAFRIVTRIHLKKWLVPLLLSGTEQWFQISLNMKMEKKSPTYPPKGVPSKSINPLSKFSKDPFNKRNSQSTET